MQFLILFIQIVSQFLIGFITQPSLYNQLVLIIFGRCFDYTSVTETSIGSLSNDVFERRTSKKILEQIVSWSISQHKFGCVKAYY